MKYLYSEPLTYQSLNIFNILVTRYGGIYHCYDEGVIISPSENNYVFSGKIEVSYSVNTFFMNDTEMKLLSGLSEEELFQESTLYDAYLALEVQGEIMKHVNGTIQTIIKTI